MLASLRRRIAAATVLVAAAAVPAAAQARLFPTGPVAGGGAYVTQTCGESGSAAGWLLAANSHEQALKTVMECAPVYGHNPTFPDSFIDTGIGVSDRLGDDGGVQAVDNDHVALTYTTATGTAVTRVRMWRGVAKSDDNDWQPYIALGAGSPIVDQCEISPASTYCAVGGDGGWYPNGTMDDESISYSDLQNLSTTGLTVGLRCRPNAPAHLCGNSASLHITQAAVYSAFFTVSDPSSPAPGTPSGTGWTTGDWAQGTLPLSLSSTDNTGIGATRVYADGSLIATLQRSCRYDQPRPCTDEPTGPVGLPTAGLPDGLHTIQVAAVDAADNETRLTRPTPLRVDNHAPAAPVGLSSPAATSTANSFSAGWTLPNDAGTPIVAARYQLCQRGTCSAVQTSPSLTTVSGLALAAAGEATLRVWLVDQLGHAGAEAPATLGLRYAPPAPPTAGPPPPAPTPPPTPTPAPAAMPAPNPVVKAGPALKLTAVRRSGRRVTVAGKLSTKASGRVTVRYHVRQTGRTRSVTRRVRIIRGAFRLTFTLPPAIAKPAKATLTVTYAGDADTNGATAHSALRIRSR